MSDLNVKMRDGGDATLSEPALEKLRRAVRGRVVTSGVPEYDVARTVWNAMIDRRPALIVRCTDPGDVVQAVELAREHDLLICREGGGHNIAGNAVCDGGLHDRPLADEGRARRSAAPGPPASRAAPRSPTSTATAQAFGLATPLGINSTTGVAGLTLGGGFGWLSRQLRTYHRQPDLGRGRHGRRRADPRERERERGPLLGASAAAAGTSAS